MANKFTMHGPTLLAFLTFTVSVCLCLFAYGAKLGQVSSLTSLYDAKGIRADRQVLDGRRTFDQRADVVARLFLFSDCRDFGSAMATVASRGPDFGDFDRGKGAWPRLNVTLPGAFYLPSLA